MEDLNLGELGGNGPSDIAWLCSLTESEIDFLLNLKILVIQRAERVGAEYLAEEFNLKMLRAFALILMDRLQGNNRDLSGHPKLVVLASRLDACNLLKLNPQDAMNLVEMKACLDSNSKKELVKRQFSKSRYFCFGFMQGPPMHRLEHLKDRKSKPLSSYEFIKLSSSSPELSS